MLRKRYSFMICVVVRLAGAVLSPAAAQAPPKKITYEQAYGMGMGMRDSGFFRMGERTTWLDDENYLVRETDEKTKSMGLMKVTARTGAKTPYLDFESIQKGLPRGLSAATYAAASADLASARGGAGGYPGG